METVKISIKKYDVEQLRETLTSFLTVLQEEEESAQRLADAIVERYGIDRCDIFLPAHSYKLSGVIKMMWRVFVEDGRCDDDSDLEWFIYECEFGKKGYSIKGYKDTKEYDIYSIEDFVDYIMRNYFDVQREIPSEADENTPTEDENKSDMKEESTQEADTTNEDINDIYKSNIDYFNEFTKTLSESIKFMNDFVKDFNKK